LEKNDEKNVLISKKKNMTVVKSFAGDRGVAVFWRPTETSINLVGNSEDF